MFGLIPLIFLFITSLSFAVESKNSLFGIYKNSLIFSNSFGIRFKEDNSIHNFSIQYSKPNSFMRLDGRVNVEAIYITDFKEKNDINSVQIAGLSQDFIVFNCFNFSFGGGLGIYIKDKKGNIVNSRFTFGEKAFLSYTINENILIEFFYKHLSNGDVTDINHGYNFAGFALGFYY